MQCHQREGSNLGIEVGKVQNNIHNNSSYTFLSIHSIPARSSVKKVLKTYEDVALSLGIKYSSSFLIFLFPILADDGTGHVTLG